MASAPATGTAPRRATPGARSAPAAQAEPAAHRAEQGGAAHVRPGHQTQLAIAQPSSLATHSKPSSPPSALAATNPAQPQLESEGPDSQSAGSRGQGSLARTAPGFSAAAAQSLPFRLETGAPPSEPAATQPGPTAEPATASTPLPEAETTVLQQGADVTIGLDSNQRLDVTIATATQQSADRLEAARTDLQRDLAALGAEVEAIRVEVRSERAPDGPGQSGQSATPGGQSERQGQAMRNRNDQSGEPPSMVTGPHSQPAIHIALNPNAGRIDRYA